MSKLDQAEYLRRTIPAKQADGTYLVALSHSQYAIIEEESVSKVEGVVWSAHWDGHWKVFTATHSDYSGDTRQTIYMHRLVMEAKKGEIVDHINHLRLDNRLSNLRIVTSQQNAYNNQLYKNNKSGYPGVHYQVDKWVARIRKNGKRIYLGQYATAEEANEAYQEAATKYFGKYKNTHLLNKEELTEQRQKNEWAKGDRERRKIPVLQKDGSYLVELTRGQFACIDANSVDKVKKYLWCALWYPHRKVYNAANGKLGKMHRYLMDAPDHLQVDHINHNTLDNRCCNLRLCTNWENSQNRRKMGEAIPQPHPYSMDDFFAQL